MKQQKSKKLMETSENEAEIQGAEKYEKDIKIEDLMNYEAQTRGIIEELCENTKTLEIHNNKENEVTSIVIELNNKSTSTVTSADVYLKNEDVTERVESVTFSRSPLCEANLLLPLPPARFIQSTRIDEQVNRVRKLVLL